SYTLYMLYLPTEYPRRRISWQSNCGFGLIAHMKGESSHHLVETAIHSLSCMKLRYSCNFERNLDKRHK
ncbi:MAG TPA: hypothetical protein EYP08_01885, partial [Pyrodictiaceae archaeon]|nr:hypothetical protein [Pyrodictiaceae archaeon]